MTEKMIIDAYCHIRKIDNTIPDEVLDFMKDCAIEKIRFIERNDNNTIVLPKDFAEMCSKMFGGKTNK